MKITTVPSKEAGSRIVVEFAGLVPQTFFVINEDGSYKVVASNSGLGEVGTKALYLLHHDQEPEATALLNWKRDLVQKEQGDDPFGGLLFARLWTTGQSKGPQAIELAAASLLSDKSTLLTLLPQVITARKNATTDTERDNFDLLLATIYLRAEDSARAKLISQQLLDRQHDSATAVPWQAAPTALPKSGRLGKPYSMPDCRGFLTTAVFCDKAQPKRKPKVTSLAPVARSASSSTAVMPSSTTTTCTLGLVSSRTAWTTRLWQRRSRPIY
jgi:hypothetical protein